ncbi:MAG: ATP-binding cassette domain-containing protein [Gemmatimonas sp.]|nr:ATP-binding cassette domain-containing protein [Gemmatimonas sp.]
MACRPHPTDLAAVLRDSPLTESDGRRPFLELDEATVIRNGLPILDRVSLSVSAGENTAIVGPNGSGKSTLIKLLTYQIYPVARADGRPPVRIFGRHRWNVTELRSRMGIITADLHHRFVSGSSMGHVTGLEAVVAGFLASEVLFFHHEVTAEMRQRAAAALDRVDGSRLGKKRMHEMSTGEVRRVLVARALVHEPELLVLDEPTTGLDLIARHEFLSQLRRLAASETTLVLVTHHVEEIIPEIERVVLLCEGRVAADDPTDDVLTPERLGSVYGSDVAVQRVGDRYEMTLRT